MDEDEDGAEIIYCRYGQCADRIVPCPSCVRILVDGQESEDGE
jgi:predicted  nucleic acid-binding Zn-ribbon protein